MLAASFLAQFATANDKPVQELSLEGLRLQAEYGWPGNVRALKSAIEYSLIGCKSIGVLEYDLPPEVDPSLDII